MNDHVKKTKPQDVVILIDIDDVLRIRPQKPKVIKYFYGEYYECPNCKLIIMQHETKDTNYCKKCEQKFNWNGIREEV